MRIEESEVIWSFVPEKGYQSYRIHDRNNRAGACICFVLTLMVVVGAAL